MKCALAAACCSLLLLGAGSPAHGKSGTEAAAVSVAPVHFSSTKKVLYIGDSLSVGAFGDAMQAALIAGGSGRERVAIYASCGSSVQHWLSSEPVHVTPCGYRETTSASRIFEDYHNGVKPRPMETPKIEKLLKKHRPDIVIIQLGTNHFDTLEKGGMAALARQEEIFEEFARNIVKTTGNLKQVIWILPPDSSKFASSIQSAISKTIRQVAERHNFSTIDSRKMTRYIYGKTGGDGVHYSTEPALQWARDVITEINRLLMPRVHVNSSESKKR